MAYVQVPKDLTKVKQKVMYLLFACRCRWHSLLSSDEGSAGKHRIGKSYGGDGTAVLFVCHV